VRVRIRARVRLGVSLDGNQGEEYDSQGALVKDVLDDSPAEGAGLQEGDIITHLNGQSLLNAIPDEDEEEFDEDESLPVQRLMALAGDLEDGEEVEVGYLRDGAAASVSLTAAERENNWVSVLPEDFEGRIYSHEGDGFRTLRLHMSNEDELSIHMEDLEAKFEDLHIELDEMDFGEGKAWTMRTRPNADFFGPEHNFVFRTMHGLHSNGLELRDLNPELGAYFSTESGVLVMEVDDDSTLGLESGDVILSIGDREVEDTGDVFRILGSYEDEEAVTFNIMRHGLATQVHGTIG
jgi:S1-C subfamily serine protease